MVQFLGLYNVCGLWKILGAPPPFSGKNSHVHKWEQSDSHEEEAQKKIKILDRLWWWKERKTHCLKIENVSFIKDKKKNVPFKRGKNKKMSH